MRRGGGACCDGPRTSCGCEGIDIVTQPVHASQVQRLRKAGHQVTGLADPHGIPSKQLAPRCVGAHAVISQFTDTIGATVLGTPGLRIVANVAAGYDNIDVRAASSRGIQVAITPGVLTGAIADLALALILAVARHVPAGDAAVRSGGTGPWRLLHEPMGMDLSVAVLGIIGMGRIGVATARRANRGFGMEIVYTSRTRNLEAEKELGATYMSLDALLARADVVSLHAVLTEETPT